MIDGYLITFGSLLLLAGRLGDLFGRKRIFLLGVASFVAASMLCGLAPTGPALVVARFLQGGAASLASAVIIAIIAVEFTEPAERAKAMSLYTFVIAGRLDGPSPRRRPDRGDQLALDLLHQSADRHRHRAPRPKG